MTAGQENQIARKTKRIADLQMRMDVAERELVKYVEGLEAKGLKVTDRWGQDMTGHKIYEYIGNCKA